MHINDNHDQKGQEIYDFISDLFPILRSITGKGVRETLNKIQTILPEMTIHSVPSATKVLDWTIPEEWNCDEAYILTPEGHKICDMTVNNLHVVNYSTPIHQTMSLADLQPHLHSLPNKPNAIPYVTSYYKKSWGFCLSHREREDLKDGDYQVVINSTLEAGELNYGELLIPASDPSQDKEIFISTYICHPSMANNELSGPGVVTFLATYISQLKERRYNYRLIFIPETIGAITYLSQHLEMLKQNVVAGFNVSCVGDNNAFSYLPSRAEDSLSDDVAQHVLKHLTDNNYKTYSFLDRGSDERQYCSPGADLPIATICRSKYGEYDEYHTSLDNLDYVSPEGFQGAYEAYKLCVDTLENNKIYKATKIGEPQLGKYGLYQQSGDITLDARTVLNVLAYADGQHSLLDIAEILNLPIWSLSPYIESLMANNLLEEVK